VTAWVYAPRALGATPSDPMAFSSSSRTPSGEPRTALGRTWSRNAGSGSRSRWAERAPPTGFVATGFDPSRIIAVGVKFALGADPTAKFEGTVYLDAVDW